MRRVAACPRVGLNVRNVPHRIPETFRCSPQSPPTTTNRRRAFSFAAVARDSTSPEMDVRPLSRKSALQGRPLRLPGCRSMLPGDSKGGPPQSRTTLTTTQGKEFPTWSSTPTSPNRRDTESWNQPHRLKQPRSQVVTPHLGGSRLGQHLFHSRKPSTGRASPAASECRQRSSPLRDCRPRCREWPVRRLSLC